MKNGRNFFFGMHIVLPLLIGLLLYIFFGFLPLRFLTGFMSHGFLYSSRNTKLLYQALPDLFWAYSFTWALSIIIENCKPFIIFFVALIFFSAFEIFQKYKIISGTFDLFDICWYAVGSIVACTFIFKKNKYANKITLD